MNLNNAADVDTRPNNRRRREKNLDFSLGQYDGRRMRRPAWSGFGMEAAWWDSLNDICVVENITGYDFIEAAKRQFPHLRISIAVQLRILAYFRDFPPKTSVYQKEKSVMRQGMHSFQPNEPRPFKAKWSERRIDRTTAVDGEPDGRLELTPVTLHVLVVDDVAMNREVAESFLSAAGHEVVCVEGGAEAILAVETADFDVVLMDVRMPEMDGLEATRRIRALGNARAQVPIVALTARAFPEQAAECIEAGMNSHLPKPFDPDTLVAAVLHAHATGRTHGESFSPASISVFPIVDLEQQILNPVAFGRTASLLTPLAVVSHLAAIAERAGSLLRGLRAPDVLVHSEDEVAEAARAIAGSAGLFGFERLTAVARRFDRAIHYGAADALAVVDDLSAELEVAVETIQRCRLDVMPA